MSSKISGRHTLRQKKLVGGDYFGAPIPQQQTCTFFQWLIGQCPPQNFGQPACTTYRWLTGQCPSQNLQQQNLQQQGFTQYGGNMQMMPPQVVNPNTGAFKFLDPMTNTQKVFDPTTSTIRVATPQDMPVDPRMVQFSPPSFVPFNNDYYIKFIDTATRYPKLFNPRTSIIMAYNPTTAQFNPDRCPQPMIGNPQQMMGNPQLFGYGGKLNKHGVKGSKTRKGGKTRRNRK